MEGECKNSSYGPLVLRIALGLLFVIPGLSKLANPAMIIGMLGQIGFPAAGLFGWLLLLSEIIFGAAIGFGYKVRSTVWPLVLIMAVAVFTVVIPSFGPENPMAMINLLFHLVAIAGLVSLYLTGAGLHALGK